MVAVAAAPVAVGAGAVVAVAAAAVVAVGAAAVAAGAWVGAAVGDGAAPPQAAKSAPAATTPAPRIVDRTTWRRLTAPPRTCWGNVDIAVNSLIRFLSVCPSMEICYGVAVEFGTWSAEPAEIPDVSDFPVTLVGAAAGVPLVLTYDPPEQLPTRITPKKVPARAAIRKKVRRVKLVDMGLLVVGISLLGIK